MKISPYYILLIIIFVAIFILIICWIFVVKAKIKFPTETPVLTNVGYGSRCLLDNIEPDYTDIKAFNPRPCQEGLTCVQYSTSNKWGICKTSIGSKCDSLSQCVPQSAVCSSSCIQTENGQVCSGICSLALVGGLNQPGPCNDGLSPNYQGICKLDEEQSGCNISSDCKTNSCVATLKNNNIIRVCKSQRDNGAGCFINSDCMSSNCSEINKNSEIAGKFCQPLGITSGNEGASCRVGVNTPNCNSGLSCYKDFSIDNGSEYGTCQNSSEGWPSYCITENPCISPSICWAGQCELPRTINTFKTNSCGINTTGLCISGYNCVGTENATCTPQSGVVVPYPNLDINGNPKKWTLFKWSPNTNTIGEWVSISSIDRLPVPNTNLSCTSNLSIYNSPVGWVAIYGGISKIISVIPNFQISGQPSYTNTLTPINILITPASGLLITYSLANGNVYRSYLFKTIPVPTDLIKPFQIVIPIYSIQSTYQSPPNFIAIDDRGSNDSIRILVVGSVSGASNVLSTGMTSLNKINGLDNSSETILINRITGALWGQFYSFSISDSIDSIDEFAYKLVNSENILISNDNADDNTDNIPKVIIPPLMSENIIENSRITTQSLYSVLQGGLSEVKMIYIVNYPIEIGGVQLRIIQNTQDVIMPGYFSSDPRCQISITADTGEYYIITPST